MRQFAVLAATLCVVESQPAHALKSNFHEQLVLDACRHVSLPPGFCERVARDAVNVDAFDWADLTAHAMPQDDEDRCAGANHVLQRVHQLGARLRQEARALAEATGPDNADALARTVGRLLHLVEDNCGHRGISDPQHSWLAQSNTCLGTPEDLDAADSAVACAAQDTGPLMDNLVTLFAKVGVTNEMLALSPGAPVLPPPPTGVCDYFAKARRWDGVDTRWDNGAMRSLLLRQARGSMLLPTSKQETACADTDLAPAPPQDAVDTTDGAPRCWQDFLLCPATGAPDLPPAPEEASGCCSAPPVGCTGLALLVVLRRRRRTETPRSITDTRQAGTPRHGHTGNCATPPGGPS